MIVLDATGAASGSAAPAPPKVRGVWLPALMEAEITYREYVAPDGKLYKNYKIRCPCHDNCFKTRGEYARSTRRHGHTEPLAFLHAWIPLSDPDGIKRHTAMNPTDEAVSAVATAHASALQGLYNACRALV